MSEEEKIILPDGFTRVAYLESTGTEYINTGLIPNETYGFYADVQSLGGTGYVAGTQSASSKPGFWLRVSSNVICGSFQVNNAISCSTSEDAYNRIVVKNNFLNDKKLVGAVGEVKTTYSSTFTYQWLYNFTIFRATFTSNTHFDPCVPIRVFRWKMSIGTEIVRDFIPCTDADGVPCMYDLITQSAYYNEGSGVFKFEEYVEEEEENTHVDLPNGYTKLDYLYSEGNQYIDTGYVPTNETGLYIDCQSYNTKISSPFGCRNNTSTDSRFYTHRASSAIALGWITYESISTTSSFRTRRYESRLNFKNSRIAKITMGDEYEHEKVLSDLSFTPTSPIYIFDYSINGNVAGASLTTENGHCGKIFRAKISQGDIVVRDYVPALDPDGIPCMFEVFTGEAYYNQGSGKFLTPLDFQRTKVPKNFKRVPWLESSGTQYINTGYIPNNETGLWIKYRKNNPATATGLQIPFGASGGGSYIYPPSINNTYLQYSWNGYTTTNGSYYYVDDGEACESSLNFYNSRIISFTSSQNNFYKTNTANIGAITKPLYVFSFNDNGTARYSLIGKVYRAKISQLDTVVRDYLPCIDEAGIPCMYDLVTQTAYYNVGTNKFSFLGGTTASYTDYCSLGIISDRLGVGDMDESVNGTLPSEFEKMNYISFDKTQYIDTEMVCDDIGEMEIKIETGNEVSTSSSTIWGGTIKGTSSSGSSYIYFNYSGDWGWMVNSYPELMSITSNKNWQSLKPNTLYDVKFTESSDMKTRDITVNGETRTLTIVSGYASTRSTINYYLGCRNKDGAKEVGGIYPFKLYSWSYKTRGGTLKAKMIPAKRKSDSQIGMYCLSRRTFYPVKSI